MKNIVLIRHGQSLGQTAHERGMSREDVDLVDCFLTKRGIREALELRSNETLSRYDFDLVVTSPLTRAVATCVLAMGHITGQEMKQSGDGIPTTPFIAHANISEAGKGIPENFGREVKLLKKDLKRELSKSWEWDKRTQSTVSSSSLACIDHIDFSLLPKSWPLVDDESKSGEKRKLDLFLKWLSERQEKNIAIFCHFNIIRWLLDNRVEHILNCVPIECVLIDDGNAPRLRQKSDE
jgi:broad specificity phosphatase PhoE